MIEHCEPATLDRPLLELFESELLLLYNVASDVVKAMYANV